MTTHRRRFLARLGLGSAALGTFFGSTSARAESRASAAGPTPHELDDWMNALPTAHRMVFDTVSAAGARDTQHYAMNVFNANRTGYGLDKHDVGVILVLRHNATPFGFNDAMWDKYG